MKLPFFNRGPAEPVLDRFIHWSLLLTALWTLVFPFLLGGRDNTALDLAVVVICLAAILAAIGEFKSRGVRPFGKLSRSLVVVALLGLTLSLAQLVPIPLSILESISLRVAADYRSTGAAAGALTVDRAITAEQVYWFAALLLAFVSFLRLPTAAGKEGRDRINDFILRSIIVSGTLCAVVALLHWALKIDPLFGIWGQERPYGLWERAHWPFVNPNHLATFLQISILVALTRFFFSRRERRSQRIRGVDRRSAGSLNISSGEVGLLFVLLLMFLALLLTLSRAGISACLFGTFLLSAYAAKQSRSHRPKSIGRWVVPAAWAAAVVLLLLFLLGGTGRDLLASRVEYGLSETFDQNRKILALASAQLIRDFPIWGTGLGTWHLAVARYLTLEMSGWTLDFAHNDYLQLFAEMGVFGVLLLITGISCYMKWLIKVLRLPPSPEERVEIVGLSVALFIPMLHAWLDFPFHIPAILFSFILLLALAVRSVEAALDKAASVDVLSDALEQ